MENHPSKEIDFFEFIYKRQLIWYKRFVLRENPPWTKDKILSTYKIINMYRELDKCTIYFVEKMKDIGDRQTLLINSIFYRFFNRVGLYEELGIKPFKEIDDKVKKYIIEKFSENNAKGMQIFNNAYIISSGGGGRKHVNVLNSLSKINLPELIKNIDDSKTPEESFEHIKKIPMVGPFLACEIWTDLTYFQFFKQKWTDDDFVNIGPGAKWGLELMYGGISKTELKAKLNNLHRIQKEILPKIHTIMKEPLSWEMISYKNAATPPPFLSITNIEGCLCEFRKYTNISNGKGRRKYFSPISSPSENKLNHTELSKFIQ